MSKGRGIVPSYCISQTPFHFLIMWVAFWFKEERKGHPDSLQSALLLVPWDPTSQNNGIHMLTTAERPEYDQMARGS